MKDKIKLFLYFMCKFIVNRLKLKPIKAPWELKTQRYITCMSCPYRADNQCMACGCFIKAKVKFQDSECPMNMWRS